MQPPEDATLADVGEDELLAQLLPLLRPLPRPLAPPAPATMPGLLPAPQPRLPGEVLVGAGDDAAVVATDLATVVTTDALVRGQDWHDEWSGPLDVGHKAVAQNLADVAAMGARPTGLVVVLLADPATSVAWALDLTRGIAATAHAAGVEVLGGDLSAAPPGVVAVSITAFGTLEGRRPVLRSGARPGDTVCVAGTLGLSGAGLVLLERGHGMLDPTAVQVHRRPMPPLAAGPAAALAGATAMIDLSDGLVRDLGRVARASGVGIDLSQVALAPFVARLMPTVGLAQARDCVLAGGEEHSLLATFPGPPAPGFLPIGRVVDGQDVTISGEPVPAQGWDHFGG